MRKLNCQLSVDVIIKLDYKKVTYNILAWGRSGHTTSVKIVPAVSAACCSFRLPAAVLPPSE